MILGAVIGDIVGSRFEFDNYRGKDFELLTENSGFTDDSICTAAVAEWAAGGCFGDLALIMQRWCRRYPSVGYGTNFNTWIWSEPPKPYDSWGNGAAMRVSPVAWMFDTLSDTLNAACDSATITHNHPEGIKGAQATAAAIFWARTGENKAFIRENISGLFGYDLSKSCDEIRPVYFFNESCQDTVPQAITAFLESDGFEDAVRLAVSLGGDSDTLAAITGSVAEAYYRALPRQIVSRVLDILPEEVTDVLSRIPTNS